MPPTGTRPHQWIAPAGTINGTEDDDVWRATGIRYAVAERFGRPRLAPPATEPIDATRPSNACPQVSFEAIDAVLEGLDLGITYDEDCLRLSVTVPAGTAPDAHLPVMVWIHGGSYLTGAGDLPIYDPTDLVCEQGVVVVNVTYRLGLFGYLARPGVPGNLGLLDQRTALEWVRDNIAAFGGDPTNVTTFGESAGGDSVAHLMLCAPDLMRRAIVMSAPLGLMPRRARMSAAMADRVGELPADAAVDDILAATRGLEKFALRFGLKGAMPFGPQYGVDPLPAERDLDDAWRQVAGSIDLLIGHTFCEGALFTPPQLGNLPAVGSKTRDGVARGLTRRIYSHDAKAFAARHRAAGGRGGYYVITSGRGSGATYAGGHTTDLPLVLGSRASWDAIVRASGPAWAVTDDAAREVRAIWAGFARDGSLTPRDADPITVEPFA